MFTVKVVPIGVLLIESAPYQGVLSFQLHKSITEVGGLLKSADRPPRPASKLKP